MSLLDDFKRMIRPTSDEDDDYDVDFDEQDSPFLDERPRMERDRPVVGDRRGKVVNIHATTQLKVVLVTSSPGWPTPGRARSRRWRPTPTSSPPTPWTSRGI